MRVSGAFPWKSAGAYRQLRRSYVKRAHEALKGGNFMLAFRRMDSACQLEGLMDAEAAYQASLPEEARDEQDWTYPPYETICGDDEWTKLL